jgi:hypothetical protein
LRICVFCSANSDLEADYFAKAREFSAGLASRGWELIYGGAQVGLMGCFADAILAQGGVARGAITEGLARTRENPHPGIQELVVVRDLFERKRWMMDEADAFVIYPGGYGTLDEALEVITWKALECHRKPIVFVNLGGFWQTQLQVFAELASAKAIRPGGLDLFEVCENNEGVWRILDELRL